MPSWISTKGHPVCFNSKEEIRVFFVTLEWIKLPSGDFRSRAVDPSIYRGEISFDGAAAERILTIRDADLRVNDPYRQMVKVLSEPLSFVTAAGIKRSVRMSVRLEIDEWYEDEESWSKSVYHEMKGVNAPTTANGDLFWVDDLNLSAGIQPQQTSHYNLNNAAISHDCSEMFIFQYPLLEDTNFEHSTGMTDEVFMD
jgi:hypothetical protein